ncbi:MAG: RecX family transcriptional regulator [Acholeplasmataceae bacterium]
MIIKVIKPKNKDFEITFTNNDKIVVSEDILVKYNLFKDKEINNLNEIYEEINIEKIYKKARNYALYGRSINQMKKYFEKHNITNNDYLIKRLEKEFLIDDEKIINTLLTKNYSKLKLRESLNKYLFEEEKISLILEDYDELSALNYCYNLVKNKYNNNQKLFRYLVQKGFNEELVKNLLNIF